jgi:DNA polymerase-1
MSRLDNPIGLDFETEPIRKRPDYPPKPVGVSIKMPSWRTPKYFAWGHSSGGNNCSEEDGKRHVREALKEACTLGLVCHHGSFDLDVAEAHCGAVAPPEDKCHDTMFLLALDNPHAFSLELKPSAERLLGLPPDERDTMREWLWVHNVVPRSRKDVGEFISKVPGNIVAPYANGDVERTIKLFKHLAPSIRERGMWEAYRREQRLLPMLRRNEAEGIRVDLPLLQAELPKYEAAQQRVEQWMLKRLGVAELDFDSPRKMVSALDDAGSVSDWSLTEKGNKSLSKKTTKKHQFADQELWLALGYRARLTTFIRTFMRPWLEQAENTGGLIHTHWRQMRGSSGSDEGGARSNRLQSSPNFQNIPKDMEEKQDGWEHPTFIKNLEHLPLIRKYVLADKPTHLIGRRDYSSQEIRILAHFEDGALLQAFLENPWLDVHQYVRERLAGLGLALDRGSVKTINFGMLYGMGLGTLAERIQRTVEEARGIKRAQQGVLPGVKTLEDALKFRGRSGQSIRTWGGRQYFCEPPRKLDNGGIQTFEYKLLNYLIQGTAADCTKEALCRYYEAGYGDARFMLTVHDEIDISAPKKALKREMLRLRDIMMSVEFDVPMLSEGEVGARWSELEELKEPEPNLSAWS